MPKWADRRYKSAECCDYPGNRCFFCSHDRWLSSRYNFIVAHNCGSNNFRRTSHIHWRREVIVSRLFNFCLRVFGGVFRELYNFL